jgi:hypothetical protein
MIAHLDRDGHHWLQPRGASTSTYSIGPPITAQFRIGGARGNSTRPKIQSRAPPIRNCAKPGNTSDRLKLKLHVAEASGVYDLRRGSADFILQPCYHAPLERTAVNRDR